jgi:hypothetical protein
MVDEETQRNDIEVIRQILKTPDTIPVQKAYDFRFAREADRQLTQSAGDHKDARKAWATAISIIPVWWSSSRSSRRPSSSNLIALLRLNHARHLTPIRSEKWPASVNV